MKKIITKEMIEKGWNYKLINLILSPHDDGIVCQIGDNWFYFGGITAEEYNNVEKYKKDIPTSEILNEIYIVLKDFKTELEDEYLYYYYYLTEEFEKIKEKYPMKKTKRLHISMAYTYVGDTGIDIPLELLEGKTEEEQYKIAYQYAQEHIGEIPVAKNAEYVVDSDTFEINDIEWEEEQL